MRRREFLGVLGGAAVSWPAAATAQRSATPVIGFLGAASAPAFAPQLDGFRKGLAEAGFREGTNVSIEYRWADNQGDRLPPISLHGRVDMIVASGPPAAVAAKAATAITPVVFVVGR